ncbi:MAG: outer membrane lipoprotein chaperone LolA [Terriglobales bacterium]
MRKFALFLLFAFAIAASGQEDVRQIARRVDDHYNRLRTMETHFVENYRGAGMTRSESGTLWLKRPGRMRWEYEQPREKLFLADGQTAWFYIPGERQARKAPVKKLDDLRSPLAYLLGKTKLEKEFAGLSLAPDVAPLAPGNVVLRGVPKSMADRLSEVLLEVTPDGRIDRIVAHEVDGSTTEFHFSNQRENVSISDRRFKFSPPPGVETIEASELGQ